MSDELYSTGDERADLVRQGQRFTIVPHELLADQEISDRAFRLWCRLDRFAGARGTAFPARSTMAEALRCSRDSIDRALRELVRTGWLQKTPPSRAGGVCCYVLVSDPDARVRQGGTPRVRQGGRTGASEKEYVVKEHSTPNGVDAPKKQKRRTRIPDDFTISPSMRAWAHEKTPTLDIDETTHRFILYWEGEGKVKADWLATWKLWMLKEAGSNAVQMPKDAEPIVLPFPPRDVMDDPKAYLEWARAEEDRIRDGRQGQG